MDAITAPAGITDDEWAATPPAVRTLVQELLAQIKQLEERVRAVEESARQTSRTTSRPPSSDPPSMPPRPPRRSTGRPSGGQVGHEGHGRPLLPPEQVTRIVEVKPQACEQCGQALGGDDPHPARHQVAEVPPVTPEVTEYRQHCLTCAGCGTQTRAPWPAEMAPGGFGPRVQATVAYLTGRLGVSQRDVAELLETLYGLEISLGSITALEQTVSGAVADPVAAAQDDVQVQPVVNMDETGWHEATQRRWLWTAVTPLITVFAVLTTRGRAGAQALVGPTYGGIVGSDRWSAYTWVAPARRQLCWAHLQRDFAAFVERGGPSAQIGQALLEVSDQMFTLWYRVRDGTLSPAAFTQLMPPHADTGACAFTRGDGRGPQHHAQDLREHSEAGDGPVDVCHHAGCGADQQRRRARLAPCCRLASAELWHPEPRRQPLRCTPADRGNDPAPAAPCGAGLPHCSLCGGAHRCSCPLLAPHSPVPDSRPAWSGLPGARFGGLKLSYLSAYGDHYTVMPTPSLATPRSGP